MPTRNPNTVLDTARQDWADWLPGDGTAYRVRIIPIKWPDTLDEALTQLHAARGAA